MRAPVVCVDFDGTIVEHDFPRIGAPVTGAIDWMKAWARSGARIVLFTMRSGEFLDEAVEYLHAHQVPLLGINENPEQRDWSASPKAFGHIYVDDAAYGCPLVYPASGARPFVDWSKVGPGVAALLARNPWRI